jgi:hypothetical protein
MSGPKIPTTPMAEKTSTTNLNRDRSVLCRMAAGRRRLSLRRGEKEMSERKLFEIDWTDCDDGEVNVHLAMLTEDEAQRVEQLIRNKGQYRVGVFEPGIYPSYDEVVKELELDGDEDDEDDEDEAES